MKSTRNKVYLILFLILLTGVFYITPVEAYNAPIGVPAPEFGIDETHLMYQSSQFDFGSGLENYKDAGNGPYTHYVDDSGDCSDSQEYGTESNPRCNIPTDLEAGSVVEIHGGPYSTRMSGKNQYIMDVAGTLSKPIFIRGVSTKPVIQAGFNIRGEYVIIENLYFDNYGMQIPYYQNGVHYHAKYVSVRNCELAGDGQPGGGSVISVSTGNHSDPVENIVLYNNEIHHFGKYDHTSQNDYHGVGVGANTKYIWLLDSHIHHNGGDSIQVNYYSSSPDLRAQYIYIAGNEMHGDMENAVDIKQALDVIISENQMYGYKGSSSSAGSAVAIHYDPERVWVLNNEIYDSEIGLITTGSEDTYFIGNLIYNIHHAGGGYDPESVYDAGVAIHARNAGTVNVVNNTIYNMDTGISTAVNDAVNLINNIIAGRTEPQAYDINYFDSTAQGSEMISNVVYQESGARINWSGDYSVLEIDPLFISSSDLHLEDYSSAIDSGIPSDVYQTFYNSYGINIISDLDGTTRPQGLGWDLGAFESLVAYQPQDPDPEDPDETEPDDDPIGAYDDDDDLQLDDSTGDIDADDVSSDDPQDILDDDVDDPIFSDDPGDDDPIDPGTGDDIENHSPSTDSDPSGGDDTSNDDPTGGADDTINDDDNSLEDENGGTENDLDEGSDGLLNNGPSGSNNGPLLGGRLGGDNAGGNLGSNSSSVNSGNIQAGESSKTPESDTAIPERAVNPNRAAEIVAIDIIFQIKKILPAQDADWQAVNFIAYGTSYTNKAKMSGRDRKGLLVDYKDTFGKLPDRDKDWDDVDAMARGVRPQERNLQKESEALGYFIQVNKKLPKTDNDWKFVAWIAYKMRPATRDLNLEISAINKYRVIFNDIPDNSTEWAIVRAMAYIKL